jgi:GAF domain-containing protein
MIVPDVNEFPGHIACSSDSKSEIVVCAIENENVNFILDVDSNRLNDFDHTDKHFLEELVSFLL